MNYPVKSISFLNMLIIALSILIGCGGNGDDDSDILTPAELIPDDDDIRGWKRVGPLEKANDLESLYDIINGETDIFIDNGFVSGAFQIYGNYTGDTFNFAQVKIRIYDQGSVENVAKVYDRVSTGIGIPWNGAGIESRIDDSDIDSYMAEFWQRNYFVQVFIDNKTDDALNVIKLFAVHISREIG
ncbi:hypothetical protein GF312_07910 [Candidatus Poribacteria bacterium]|nr:hypothetical protein [Candidatus Poribacteria bacterium]